MSLLPGKKQQVHKRKRRSRSQEDLLHLRRAGRYIPPPRKSWIKNLVDAVEPAFLVVEKRYIEPLANLFEEADIFKIAEKLGLIIAVFSAVVGVVFYVVESKDRKEKSILEAWEVVKDGRGEKSGVVVLALQRLHREGFRLAGVNLKDTNLSYITLTKANLRDTNFSGADFSGSNLSDTILYRADLSNTNLIGTNFMNANLSGANLSGARFGCEKDSSEKCTNFIGAKNLTPTQVKLAQNWQQAIYESEFRIQLGLPPE